MRVGSLFSGIGGIELGLEAAGGFETAWFVECEPYAQAVLRERWPDAQIYDDVTAVDWANVPRVDVLTGGFPCQDISIAGKRAGITGSRSSLWKHYLRAISVLRPKYIVAENVAALTQRGLDVVLCDLAQIGYDAEWHCVPAAALGAYHRRDRIFILAYPNSLRCTGEPGNELVQGCDGDQINAPESEGRDVSDLQGERRGETGTSSQRQEERLAGLGDVQYASGGGLEAEQRQPGVLPEGSITASLPGRWAVEPDVDRVAYGIPAGLDRYLWKQRIKALGNAVVPAVPQAIGRAIQEAEGRG